MSENKRRMQAGELYYCFTPELTAERNRCFSAVTRFNSAIETTRRHRVQLWRDITQDDRPLPPVLADADADEAQFSQTDPWILPPITIDYGTQVHIAPLAMVNANSTFIDTLTISIGARTLVGPSCSFYSGGHPVDPAVRNGMQGPESGKAIEIGEDCWLGGGVTVLPGVKIGRGATVGAGSVVTKDVEPFTVVAGNPARFIKKIDSAWNVNTEGSRVQEDETEIRGRKLAEAALKLVFQDPQ